MKPNLRRNLSGSFVPQDLGADCWRLSRGDPPEIEIFLKDVETAAAATLRCASVCGLGVEWRGEGVLLHLTAGGQARAFQAGSAIIHEPLARLYAALPLAAFDATAQRFWRRIFFLARIPGGRALLRLLAPRKRAEQSIRDEDHKKTRIL